MNVSCLRDCGAAPKTVHLSRQLHTAVLLYRQAAKKKAEEAEAARAAELKAAREKEAARQSELAAAARERKAARARQKAEAEAAAEASERAAKKLADVGSAPVASTAGSGSAPALQKEATPSTLSPEVRRALWAARAGSHVWGCMFRKRKRFLDHATADSFHFVLAPSSTCSSNSSRFLPKLRGSMFRTAELNKGCRVLIPSLFSVLSDLVAAPRLFVRLKLKLPTMPTRRPQERPPPARCPRRQR